GSSYGTRAALVYMRQHPDRVHTVTLIGVAPTYLKMPMYHAQAAARAMELLLQQCEQNAQCHEAFPKIRDDWTSVLSQLGREPARVKYSPPDESAPVMLEVQRDIFAEKIRTWMYGREQASRIPLIVHHAAQGDFTPFLREAIRPSIPDFISDGMYLSVTCAEDVPFINQEEAAKLNAGNPFGNYRVFQQTRACSMWPQGKIPPDFREPVSSNVPVLLFSGNMDPVTPPQRGEEVAHYLPNSRHVIIPQAGHGFDGLAEPACVDRIIMEMKATERWDAIVEVMDLLVARGQIKAEDRKGILASLKQREETMSTGIGFGIAIPHCSSDRLDKVVAAFGRSSTGIEFDALDNAP